MKLSWIWPSGRRSESTESDISGGGMASGGNSPCASSVRWSLPEGGGPGRDFERRRAEIQARRGPGGGPQGEFAAAPAPARLRASARLTAAGASFSIIWLNSEYGSRAAGCAAAEGCTAGENAGAGRLSISRSRMVSRTKSCTNDPCRKRTSVFDGCTFTSTSPGSHSRNSSAKGYAEAGIRLW